MINYRIYEGIKFPVSKRDYCKTERKNNICINVFCYENILTFPVYVSDQKFKKCLDLSLMSNENKLHFVYVKNFNRFIPNKIKNKITNIFANVVYVLVVKEFWQNTRKIA